MLLAFAESTVVNGDLLGSLAKIILPVVMLLTFAIPEPSVTTSMCFFSNPINPVPTSGLIKLNHYQYIYEEYSY